MLKNLSLHFVFLACLLISTESIASEAPIISNLAVSPNSGPAGTTYQLSIQITHPTISKDVVLILYQVRNDVEVIEVPLNDDGRDGDLKKGDGLYTGQSSVPPTAAKTRHRFEVFVRNKTGQKSNLLEYHFTVREGVVI